MSAGHNLYLALTALRAGMATLHAEDGDLSLGEREQLPEEATVEEAIFAAIRQANANAELATASRNIAAGNAARAERFDKREAALKGIALAAMDAIDKAKLECADIGITIKAGTKAVLITDESKLAAEYMTTPEPKPDKRKIGADLKEGVVIDGAELTNPMPILTYRTT